MAPPDRQERRQQRMRGAGASNVQGNFGFNFAALGPKVPARTVTPKLGKRKRASAHVQPDDDDGLPDELSPERDNEVPSIERTRRVVATNSALPQDHNDVTNDALDEPDELSIHLDAPPPHKSPIAAKIGNMTLSAPVALSRRSGSIEVPITPALPSARAGSSFASRLGPQFQTPNAVHDGHDHDSDDELSSSIIPITLPKVVTGQPSNLRFEQQRDEEMDELSTPPEQRDQSSPKPSARGSTRAARRRRLALDDEADELSSPPEQHKQLLAQQPASALAERRRRVVVDEEEHLEEASISPEGADLGSSQRAQAKPEAVRRVPGSPHAPTQEQSDRDESDQAQEHSDQDESNQAQPQHEERRPIQRPMKPNLRTDNAPRKRRRLNGPKQHISVMRIKGFNVRGITAADMTRTVLEQKLEHELDKMNERLRQASDVASRKRIRTPINATILFKDSVIEKLLDLQDTNDNLGTNFQKRKTLKTGNMALRKEILRLQNSRQEVAVELDMEQTAFEAEKESFDSRMRLSANMFDIQAAIQSGRELAKRQGREDEGPEMPLAMRLDSVGRSVGSIGGGLLARMKAFNSGLEKAAGWLEGRALGIARL